MQKLNELILDNVTEYKGIVNKEDLKKIKELLPNITNKTLEERESYSMADGGTTSCELWNYDLNEKIILSTSGNSIQSNNNANAEELENLINKYTT